MPERERQSNGRGQREKKEKPSDDQTLVRRVAERVWELWREDMRRSRERVGKQRGS